MGLCEKTSSHLVLLVNCTVVFHMMPCPSHSCHSIPLLFLLHFSKFCWNSFKTQFSVQVSLKLACAFKPNSAWNLQCSHEEFGSYATFCREGFKGCIFVLCDTWCTLKGHSEHDLTDSSVATVHSIGPIMSSLQGNVHWQDVVCVLVVLWACEISTDIILFSLNCLCVIVVLLSSTHVSTSCPLIACSN